MGAPLLTVFRTAVPVNHTVFCFPIELELELALHLESLVCLGKEEGRCSQSEGWEGSLGPAPGGWNHCSTEVCIKDSMG